MSQVAAELIGSEGVGSGFESEDGMATGLRSTGFGKGTTSGASAGNMMLGRLSGPLRICFCASVSGSFGVGEGNCAKHGVPPHKAGTIPRCGFREILTGCLAPEASVIYPVSVSAVVCAWAYAVRSKRAARSVGRFAVREWKVGGMVLDPGSGVRARIITRNSRMRIIYALPNSHATGGVTRSRWDGDHLCNGKSLEPLWAIVSLHCSSNDDALRLGRPTI